MALFLVLPLAMMVYVSFWTQTTFAISSDLTFKSWKTFFASDTYFGALTRTLKIWLIVLAITFALGYPAALFIGRYVKDKTIQTILLVACVIPFWTSFLIRVLAWRPMLGKEGAINIVFDTVSARSPLFLALRLGLTIQVATTRAAAVLVEDFVRNAVGRCSGRENGEDDNEEEMHQ